MIKGACIVCWDGEVRQWRIENREGGGGGGGGKRKD